MDQRLNLGNKVHELKLGSTFTTSKPRTSFHTLKYDFKPASVDLSKVATLDVSSNNQVTVTMPHLESSGVPKTVFKGNQRNYTKECVLIIDKITGEITLEKLHHNIQVKKTRSETNSKSMPFASATTITAPPPPPPLQPLPHQQSQQQLQNISQNNLASGSGTAIASTSGNNGGPSNLNASNICNLASSRPSLENSTQRISTKTRVSTGIRKAGLTNIVQRHSPLQNSPSYQQHHKSPQQAPAWNANNGQSTLPSIPMIGMDDDFLPNSMNSMTNNSHERQNQYQINSSYQSSSNDQIKQSQQLVKNSNYNNINQNNLINNNRVERVPQQIDPLNEIGILSSDSSDSSDSDNDNSGTSDSDDDDSNDDSNDDDDDVDDNVRPNTSQSITSTHLQNSSHYSQQQNIVKNQTNSMPAFLDEDLRLSESNSSDSDD